MKRINGQDLLAVDYVGDAIPYGSLGRLKDSVNARCNAFFISRGLQLDRGHFKAQANAEIAERRSRKAKR